MTLESKEEQSDVIYYLRTLLFAALMSDLSDEGCTGEEGEAALKGGDVGS